MLANLRQRYVLGIKARTAGTPTVLLQEAKTITDRTLKEKAAKLQAVTAERARLQEQADTLKAVITAEMKARAVDELKAGNALIRWKQVTTARFDSKLFREAHSALYEQYARPSTTRRFTLVPA